MSISSGSAVLLTNRPKMDEGKKTCSWKLQREFRENEGLATLGLLQSILNDASTENCSIDFEIVEWADPQPLLFLGLVLANSNLTQRQINIDLGFTDKASTAEHRIFLTD